MPRSSLFALPIVLLCLSPKPFDSSAPESHDTSHAVSPPPARSRLNRTLAGNELRYQAVVRERKAAIEKIGGPKALAIPEPHPTSYSIWGLFAPAFSCPFPVYCVRTMGDGGKYVCGLGRDPASELRGLLNGRGDQVQLRAGGIDTVAELPGYGAHAFCTSSYFPHGSAQLRGDNKANGRVHFYPYKIGAVDRHDANPKEYSLPGIMRELGHEFIDIWKIDIEGREFSAPTAIIESFKGKPLPFGQMQIEIHLNYEPDHVATVGAFDKWWTTLEDAGLRPFWTETNFIDVGYFRRGANVVEWSFINIRGKHPLVDDTLPDYP
ncbi:hypothetical protein C8J57DRAFT_1534582 [Mycena rebaudengoi]|nr:hypothetical protein C8J57DRAFT_1534582 [Mycena rebaudengoi]